MLLMAIFLACSIAGFSVLFTHFNAAAEDNGSAAEKAPAYTIHLGAYGQDDIDRGIYYKGEFVTGWGEVVSLANSVTVLDPDAYVKVILERDWVAASNTTGFGNSITVTCFDSGRILVPAGINVLIDLNGHKIDRNLTSDEDGTGVPNGQVMLVKGSLTVDDSSKEGTGVITGGFNTPLQGAANGGGVLVDGGTFNLKGGAIDGNKIYRSTYYGIGVSVIHKGTLNMYGGAIRNSVNIYNYTSNSTTSIGYGGGVGVCDDDSTFNMYGGVIEDNAALYGGGVASYYAKGNTINIQGGIIRNNTAVYYGGGVYAQLYADITVKGAEIYNNRANQNGGGVYVTANNFTMSLNIKESHIHHNVASSLKNNAYGGGVAVVVSSSSGTIDAKLSDSIIEYNRVVAKCESATTYKAQGGGVYVSGATVDIKDNQIDNNTAASFRDGDAVGNLENLCDGIATYGGGVYIAPNLSQSKLTKAVLSGGSVENNKATYGGGVGVDGELALAGSSITGNLSANGGGLYLGTAASVSLSGAPVVAENYSSAEKNTPSNINITEADEGKIKVEGELKDEANIHVLVDGYYAENGKPFIAGYGAHNTQFVSKDGYEPDNEINPSNGAWVYANPGRYFVSDAQGDNQHIVVLKNGELGIVSKEIKFVVSYSNSTTKEFVFGKSMEDMPEWNYTSGTYGDDIYPVSLTVSGMEGTEPVSIGRNAGVYRMTVSLDAEVEAEFAVVIKAKMLTESDVTVTLPNVEYTYTKEEHKPEPTLVKYDTVTFVYGSDYDLSYENNINAGLDSAVVIISFKGNYTGEARVHFSIKPSTNADIQTRVTWQTYTLEGWKTFIATNPGNLFVYDGTDQKAKIRAILNYTEDGTPHEQAVYAYGVEADDARQNKGMWLEFNQDKTKELKDAAKYSVAIMGYCNYSLESNKVDNIVMAPKGLDISADYFNNYQDDNFTRLWQLKVGKDGDVFTTLQDAAIYADPNATANEFNEKVTNGTSADTYARYRGVEMSLVLNPNYILSNDSLLADWLEFATVTYSDNTYVGKMGEVLEITTKVTISFGSNYTVIGGDDKIEFTKTWLIVTISNNLLDASTTDEVVNNELTGWTFGALSGDINLYEFRPEHGDTVIYSYYLEGSSTPVEQFALVYTEDTYITGKEYYKVTFENGKFVLGSRIYEVDYLYEASLNLRSGTYRLEVTVPQNEPNSSGHHHWFDNDVVAEDYGVIYYEFTYAFKLIITPYALATDGVADSNVTWTFPINTVEYNGQNNNYAIPYIKLGNITLIEGVDFELASESVNVGWVSLTVKDLHNPGVQFVIENAFQIVQGDNGWTDVPSIINWTYNSFNININLIRATPLFDTENNLWFAIARDRAGTDLITNLEHFSVDKEGHVSEDVAKYLKGLGVGEYYLLGRVDETDNYRALEPNPIPFVIFAATNSWETTPSVSSWVQGEYSKDGGHVVASAVFGDAHIQIYGEDGKLYYDNFEGIDELASAKAGRYTLTASVEGALDYSGLDVYTVIFQIFEAPGLPWWAILLIVVGALGLAALVIFILWKNGVFQIVTEKFVVAIRTRASVEATMASIRAAKMMEEGRQSVEDAKRRERLEKLRQKEESQQELTPEEMAAQLEAQARKDERKAEKLRERSEENRAQAAKMRGEESAPAAEKPGKKSASKKSETPTEE